MKCTVHIMAKKFEDCAPYNSVSSMMYNPDGGMEREA